MPRLVRAELAHIPSFIEALREGFSRDNLRPTTPGEIARAGYPMLRISNVTQPTLTVIAPVVVSVVWAS